MDDMPNTSRQADVLVKSRAARANRRYRLKDADGGKKCQRGKMRRFFISLAGCALAALLITCIFHSLFGIAIVSGSSMKPELYGGDVILFWKLSGSYERGDIVLVKTEGRDDYVKRICALPGETVDIDDDTGQVKINGEVLNESYIHEKTHGKGTTYPLTIGQDEYFILGDHRSDSRDSRDYGAVGTEHIDGKALVVFRAGFRK